MDYVDDGYPTEEALEMIEKWDVQDAKGFFEFVKSIWWMPNWGWQEEINEEGNKEYHIAGLGSNGTANRLKVFLLFLMALTHHVLPHLAWRRNIDRAY